MRQLILILCASLITFISFAQPAVGKQAPEIQLPNAEGKTVALSSFKGKVVLIDFWASWCGPCRRSNKGLVRLYKKFKDKGFEIYGVAVNDEAAAWQKAVKADNITWSQVRDTKEVATAWGIQYIPNTFLLDKTGKIVAINPEHDDLEKLLTGLL